MSIKFSDLLTDCLVAMGDDAGAQWSRVDCIWPWCVQAMLAFPILRPVLKDQTMAAAAYILAMPSGYREVISVEYPISQQPPSYMIRKNRLDPDFYSETGFYDVDHDYSAGAGWMMYFSQQIPISVHVKIQYLANHDTTMADDDTTVITIPDEYENILIAYVMAMGYRERLSAYMQDPTAHTNVILSLTDMVLKAEANFQELVLRAQVKLAQSKMTHRLAADKYDRVY
ncbi:MAG: hypothetical protein WAM09_16535 [Anaerolineales bacterium]